MISPIIGTQSTKQTSKQNTTRDIEIKNKLTITRGEVGEDNGREKNEAFSETTRKDTWTKLKVGGIKCVKWGWLVCGESWGEMETTVLERQFLKSF